MPLAGHDHDERERKRLVDFWTEYDAKGRPPYARLISEKLFDATLPPDLKGARVLDIGFADGELAPYFKERGARWTGVDLSPEVVEGAKARGLDAVSADCRALPFEDGTFDVTYSLGVVEHFAGTEKAIAEHVRVTKPGGTVVVAVPALWSPYNPLVLLHHVLHGTIRYGIASFGKRYTPSGLERMLEAAGLTVHTTPRLYFQSLLLVTLPGRFPRLCERVEATEWLRWAGFMIWGVGTKPDPARHAQHGTR